MEDGAARGWSGGPRGRGVRLRDGGACVAGDGARANSEALRALRFESYVTDLTDGKTWTAQHAHSLKQAKLFTQGLCANIPVHPKRDCCSWGLRALERRILRLRH